MASTDRSALPYPKRGPPPKPEVLPLPRATAAGSLRYRANRGRRRRAAGYIAASAKSLRGDELAAFEAHVRGVYPQMARIQIAPTWARYYVFGAGRMPKFLRQLDP